MIVKRLVDETKLAWSVVEAARPYLSDNERNAAYVALGAGDTFTAIRQLFRSVEINRIPLEPDLLQQCRTWLHGYRGHEDERYLRRVIEESFIPYLIAASATRRASRAPARPKPRRWLPSPPPRHATDNAAVQQPLHHVLFP